MAAVQDAAKAKKGSKVAMSTNEMPETPQEARDAIVRLAREGKVEFAGDITKIKLHDLDFSIEKVELVGQGDDCSFLLSWETVSAGFGTTRFYTKNGKLCCANECMGKQFLTSLMAKFVETCILEDEK